MIHFVIHNSIRFKKYLTTLKEMQNTNHRKHNWQTELELKLTTDNIHMQSALFLTQSNTFILSFALSNVKTIYLVLINLKQSWLLYRLTTFKQHTKIHAKRYDEPVIFTMKSSFQKVLFCYVMVRGNYTTKWYILYTSCPLNTQLVRLITEILNTFYRKNN